jgi:hypothetical protein
MLDLRKVASAGDGPSKSARDRGVTTIAAYLGDDVTAVADSGMSLNAFVRTQSDVPVSRSDLVSADGRLYAEFNSWEYLSASKSDVCAAVAGGRVLGAKRSHSDGLVEEGRLRLQGEGRKDA